MHQCRGSCRATLQKIKTFQDHDSQIRDEFDKMGSTILTNVVKRLYNLEDFNEIQEKELETKKEQFKNSFEKIRGLLIKTYEDLFIHHGYEIQVK